MHCRARGNSTSSFRRLRSKSLNLQEIRKKKGGGEEGIIVFRYLLARRREKKARIREYFLFLHAFVSNLKPSSPQKVQSLTRKHRTLRSTVRSVANYGNYVAYPANLPTNYALIRNSTAD